MGYPFRWGNVSRQRWRVRGVVSTWEYFRPPFWKICLLCSWIYVKLTISLHYKPKTRWNSDIWNLFSKIFHFRLYWKSAILSSAMIMTSMWPHTRDFGTFFGLYGKRRPLLILWYQLDVYERVSVSSWGGGLKFKRLHSRYNPHKNKQQTNKHPRQNTNFSQKWKGNYSKECRTCA